mgnify:FL=1
MLTARNVRDLFRALGGFGAKLPDALSTPEGARAVIRMWQLALGDVSVQDMEQAVIAYGRASGSKFPSPGDLLALVPSRLQAQLARDEGLEESFAWALKVCGRATNPPEMRGGVWVTGLAQLAEKEAERWPDGPPAGFHRALAAVGGWIGLAQVESNDEIPSLRKAWREAWQRSTATATARQEVSEVAQLTSRLAGRMRIVEEDRSDA